MRVLFVLLLLLTGLVFGLYYYLNQQLAYKPDWYQAGANDPLSTQVDSERVLSRIKRDLARGGSATISEEEFLPVLASALNKQFGFDLAARARAMRLDINDDGGRLEMVVDARQLPMDNLPGEAGAVVEKALGLLPDDVLSELYVGMELPASSDDIDRASGRGIGLQLGALHLDPAEILGKAMPAALSLPGIGEARYALQDGAAVLSR